MLVCYVWDLSRTIWHSVLHGQTSCFKSKQIRAEHLSTSVNIKRTSKFTAEYSRNLNHLCLLSLQRDVYLMCHGLERTQHEALWFVCMLWLVFPSVRLVVTWPLRRNSTCSQQSCFWGEDPSPGINITAMHQLNCCTHLKAQRKGFPLILTADVWKPILCFNTLIWIRTKKKWFTGP